MYNCWLLRMKGFAASYAEGGDGLKKTQLAALIILLFVLLKFFLPPKPEQEKKLMAYFVAKEENIETLGRSLEGQRETQSAFRQNP